MNELIEKGMFKIEHGNDMDVFGWNNELFTQLLIKAIGDRTKAEFARLAGIAPQRLNTLLKGNGHSQPSIQTIQKLAMAAENGVKFSDLAEAAGYTMERYQERAKTPKAERMEMSTEERIRLSEEDLLEGMQDLISTKGYNGDIDDLMDTYRVLYQTENSEYDVEGPVHVKQLVGTIDVYTITVAWDIRGQENLIPFMVFTTKEKEEMKILGYSFNAKEMDDLGVLPEKIKTYLKDEDLSQYNPAHIVINRTPWNEKQIMERMLLNMYREQKNGFYTVTSEGIGFRVVTVKNKKRTPLITEARMMDFFQNHRKMIHTDSEKQFMQAFLDQKKTLDDIRENDPHHSTDIDGEYGYELIAEIMHRETGLEIEYFDGTSSSETNPPVIMVKVQDLPEDKNAAFVYAEKQALHAMKNYARELGLERYGTQYYEERYSKNDTDQYTIEEEHND